VVSRGRGWIYMYITRKPVWTLDPGIYEQSSRQYHRVTVTNCLSDGMITYRSKDVCQISSVFRFLYFLYPGRGKGFSLCHLVQTGSGAHQTYRMGTGGFFHGSKATGAWRWPLTSIQCRVKNACSYSPTSSYVFMVMHLVKHWDNFYFTLFLIGQVFPFSIQELVAPTHHRTVSAENKTERNIWEGLCAHSLVHRKQGAHLTWETNQRSATFIRDPETCQAIRPGT